MVRKRPDQGWRAAAFAVALFAITLNFFQPLAHAVLMRDGGPEAAARTWGVFCLPTADEDGRRRPASRRGKIHECCLGLAHAPVLGEPLPPPSCSSSPSPRRSSLRRTKKPWLPSASATGPTDRAVHPPTSDA